MNDSRLNTPRKTPPTNLASLADMDREWGYLFMRDSINCHFVRITDEEEYHVGQLIGWTAARGDQRGGYIFEPYMTGSPGEGLVEWSAKAAENFYLLHERYKELLDYFEEDDDDE